MSTIRKAALKLPPIGFQRKTQPKKHFGQNYILDLQVTDKIARQANVSKCHVVEVGPGPGSLTRSLLSAGTSHVHCVEIDDRFLPGLSQIQQMHADKLTVHYQDILKFDFAQPLHHVTPVDWSSDSSPDLRLVGNLPFNVSIQVLLQWLMAVSDRSGPFQCGRVPMSLVFQREVADNLSAPPNTQPRTRLSVMSQIYCHVTRGIKLDRSVFTPPPQVDASLVRLKPLREPLTTAPWSSVEQVVKAAFAQKDKVIRKTLRALFPDPPKAGDQLAASTLLPYHRSVLPGLPSSEHTLQYTAELVRNAQVEAGLRSAELANEQYAALAEEFHRMCKVYGLNKTPQQIPGFPRALCSKAEENHCTDVESSDKERPTDSLSAVNSDDCGREPVYKTKNLQRSDTHAIAIKSNENAIASESDDFRAFAKQYRAQVGKDQVSKTTNTNRQHKQKTKKKWQYFQRLPVLARVRVPPQTPTTNRTGRGQPTKERVE